MKRAIRAHDYPFTCGELGKSVQQQLTDGSCLALGVAPVSNGFNERFHTLLNCGSRWQLSESGVVASHNEAVRGGLREREFKQQLVSP
jgi:hypothetical protein